MQHTRDQAIGLGSFPYGAACRKTDQQTPHLPDYPRSKIEGVVSQKAFFSSNHELSDTVVDGGMTRATIEVQYLFSAKLHTATKPPMSNGKAVSWLTIVIVTNSY